MRFADYAYIDTPDQWSTRYDEFRHNCCDNENCENHRLGGSSYLCHGWKSDIAGRSRRWMRDNRYEFQLCPSCVYEYHYEERPE